MVRRAERVDDTHRRIVEATVRLHTTVGPARTSIAAIADEAGVTRLTVYRHFPTLEDVFTACAAHWIAAHPMPDPSRWVSLPTLGERATVALEDLYGWYRSCDQELFPVQRDLDVLPAHVRDGQAGALEWRAGAILGDEAAARRVTALARHLVEYWTWRSLVLDAGLTDADGADLGALLLERAAER